MEVALEAGADDVQTEDGQSLVLCSPGQFEAVRSAMTEAGLEPVHADVVMAAQNPVEVSPDLVDDLQDLLDRLDGLDDVQEVFHNGVMPEEQG
jgi:transcriptional/translational regulatory protein YebC/TACO1